MDTARTDRFAQPVVGVILVVREFFLPAADQAWRNRLRFRPVIITIYERVQTALNQIEDAGLSGRIEVWDIQQFLSSNVHEHSLFDEAKQNATLGAIIEHYNHIVHEKETDPSLRIEFEAK